jgi:hypothetical protein
VSFAVEEAEIEAQHCQNEKTESDPQPVCAAQCLHEEQKIASGLGCSKRGFGLWTLVFSHGPLVFVLCCFSRNTKAQAKPKDPRPKTRVRMQLQQFAPLNYNPQFLER